MTTVENSFEKVRRKMVAARIEFMSQLARFSHDELTKQAADGEWSPLQLANHIYITDGMLFEQMQQVQNEDDPLLPDGGELAPQRTREAELPTSLEAVLAGMAARREEIFDYLSALSAEAWLRPLQHPSWGRLQFYQFVNVLSRHDTLHAQQLSSIKIRFQEHNQEPDGE